MFAKSIMIPKEKCITVSSNDSIQQVLDLLEQKQLDAVPVVDGLQYKGLINRYIVYREFFYSRKTKEEFLLTTSIQSVLTMADKYLTTESVFEQSFYQLNDFPVIAVVEDGKFQGLVTRFDMMNEFQSAFGMHQEGIRIAISSSEADGRLAKLGEVVDKYNESVISVVTFDDTDKLLRRIVLKIEKRDNLDAFLKELDRSGFRILHIQEDSE